MISDTISILDGDKFVVSDRQGNVDCSKVSTHGLFQADTRFLSRWILTVNGQRLGTLAVDDAQYFATQFFLVSGTGTIYVDSTLSAVRQRTIRNGFHEDLRILNHGKDVIELDVRIDAASDFADLFEVKDVMPKKGRLFSRPESGRLVLCYERETFRRETHITSTEDARFDEKGLSYHVKIPPHGEWSTTIDVEARDNVHMTPPDRLRGRPKSVKEWVDSSPELVTSWPALRRTYQRSLVDLAALRFPPRLAPKYAVPAAGLPWFMALFGRDSLLVSYQCLPYQPELAWTTLQTLAAWIGIKRDDFRDEEPGKILHELRWGELTAFEERPHSPYYGSADSTPLFLILLDEYERWSGDQATVRQLEKNARAALQWIDDYGDRDKDGYIEYSRRNTTTGLENQCWKDSWDSIAFADGRLAELPRATCEIQGYAYDAKRRCARLAREIWNDPELATRLEREAADLKARFNRDFWVDKHRFFALALDGKKRQVDSLTSNIGHLLWSGIVDDDKVDPVVQHLMSPAMFSGWGIRTMAEGMGSYNPIGYHVGTVWPHDNSIIAAGLRRYGRDGEAAQLCLAMLEAAEHFQGRLPEAFAGYQRQATRYPVEYPTACSPQAWASGAPLLILTTLLGLQPTGQKLLIDPAVPAALERIELHGIPGRWGRADALGLGHVPVPAQKELSSV